MFYLIIGSWTVSITTGVIEARDAAAEEEEDSDEDRSSGGQLVIVVYGDQGNTGELPLDKIDPSTAESSSSGNRDQFKVILFTYSYLVQFTY